MTNSSKEELPELMSSKDFRIQNKQLHLTYEGHIDGNKWLEWFSNKEPKKEIIEYSIVNEEGASGYKHTHILIKFNVAIQTTNSRFFDYDGIHPNIRIVKTKAHWTNCIKYHCKQGDPLTNTDTRSFTEKVWSSSTLSDAISDLCPDGKHIGGVIATYKNKPMNYDKEDEPEVKWRQWQNGLKQKMLGVKEYKNNKIQWYWSPMSRTSGTSFFGVHMSRYHGFYFGSNSDLTTLGSQIPKAMQEGRNMDTIMFDLKDVDNKKNYTGLNDLMNGYINSKSSTQSIVHLKVIPHIVVFSNKFPSIEYMDISNFMIYVIDNEGKGVLDEFDGDYLKVKYIYELEDKKGISEEEAIIEIKKVMTIYTREYVKNAISEPKRNKLEKEMLKTSNHKYWFEPIDKIFQKKYNLKEGEEDDGST